jgi:4-hydroxybenzoate polyprenyltransferase
MLKNRIWYTAAIMVVWLLIALGFLFLTNSRDPEIFFVIWLNGLLGIIILIEPHDSKPPYLRYLKYIAAIGIVIFFGIIAQKVLEIPT